MVENHWVMILDWVVRESFAGEVSFKLQSQWEEGTSHIYYGRESEEERRADTKALEEAFVLGGQGIVRKSM